MTVLLTCCAKCMPVVGVLSRVLDAMLQLKNFESQRNLELKQADCISFHNVSVILTESAVVLLTYGPSASRIRRLWTSNKGE